jgi:hypothetical protein
MAGRNKHSPVRRAIRRAWRSRQSAGRTSGWAEGRRHGGVPGPGAGGQGRGRNHRRSFGRGCCTPARSWVPPRAAPPRKDLPRLKRAETRHESACRGRGVCGGGFIFCRPYPGWPNRAPLAAASNDGFRGRNAKGPAGYAGPFRVSGGLGIARCRRLPRLPVVLKASCEDPKNYRLFGLGNQVRHV